MIRFALALLLLAAPAAGQEKTHELQPEDYFSLRTVGSIAASPDGLKVAYTLAGWEEGADRMNTDLWVVGADGENNTRLTFDSAGDGSPMWSDDGATIDLLPPVKAATPRRRTATRRSGRSPPPAARPRRRHPRPGRRGGREARGERDLLYDPAGGGGGRPLPGLAANTKISTTATAS